MQEQSPFPQCVIVYTPIGTPCPADWYGQCNNLVQSVGVFSDGGNFIGEAGCYNNYAMPPVLGKSNLGFQPEPELPMDITKYTTPIMGTKAWTSYDLTGATPAVMGTMTTRFKNFGVGPGPNGEWLTSAPWSNYQNQLQTYLEENPDTFVAGSNGCYKYVWGEGVGMLLVVWGDRARDNTLTGYMFQLSAHS